MSQQLLKISSVEGSVSTNKFNDASNAIHSNPTAFFSSAAGVGKSFIEFKLEEESEFNTLTLALLRGNERRTKFALLASKDSIKYNRVKPTFFVSSGENSNNEKFQFETTKAKYLRLVFYGNLDNKNIVDGCLTEKFKNTVDNIIKTVPTHDIGEDKQIFSLRTAVISNEELETFDEAELKNNLEEVEWTDKNLKGICECDKCEFCGGDVKNNICDICKNIAHQSHADYSFITNKFPLDYNVTLNKFYIVNKVYDPKKVEKEDKSKEKEAKEISKELKEKDKDVVENSNKKDESGDKDKDKNTVELEGFTGIDITQDKKSFKKK